MRFLRIRGGSEDDFSLEFAEYLSSALNYVIFSHTSEEKQDEVLYQDLRDDPDSAKKKPGYRKIMLCALEARRQNIEYMWAGTWCIDKSDEKELSSTINDMYHLYRNAAFCYVFLSDCFNKPGASDWFSSMPPSEQIATLGRCKWFSRGWTLQELVIPRIVQLYSAEGHKLGDRYSYARILSDITRLPYDVLKNSSVDSRSIDERLSWMSGRSITREEDTAYCMIGIMRVQMSIRYGEGQHNAMARLTAAANMGVINSRELFWDLRTIRSAAAHQSLQFRRGNGLVNARTWLDHATSSGPVFVTHERREVTTSLIYNLWKKLEPRTRLRDPRSILPVLCLATETKSGNMSYADALRAILNSLHNQDRLFWNAIRSELCESSQFQKSEPLLEYVLDEFLGYETSRRRKVVIVVDALDAITGRLSRLLERTKGTNGVRWVAGVSHIGDLDSSKNTFWEARPLQLGAVWTYATDQEHAAYFPETEEGRPSSKGWELEFQDKGSSWRFIGLLYNEENRPSSAANASAVPAPDMSDLKMAFADSLRLLLTPDVAIDDTEEARATLEQALIVFAAKVMSEDDSASHQALGRFVHESCRELATVFFGIRKEEKYDHIQEQRDDRHDSSSRDGDVALISPRLDTHGDEAPPHLHPRRTWCALIEQSSSFKWLQWKIRRDARLAIPGTMADDIRDWILPSVFLCSSSLRGENKGRNSDISRAEYRVNLRIFDFHKKEKYACTVDEMLEQSVVLTGDTVQVQATTRKEYISQTWGEDGLMVLRVVQETVRAWLEREDTTQDTPFTEARQSRVLGVWGCMRPRGDLAIVAERCCQMVTDTGEVLAWLCASFKMGQGSTINLSKPTAVYQLHDRDSWTLSGHSLTSRGYCWIGAAIGHGRMRYSYVNDEEDSSEKDSIRKFWAHLFRTVTIDSTRECWANLFETVNIVEGFPIPRREENMGGLEISMELMSVLAGARFLVRFGQRTYLKGFSTMLVVTDVTESAVMWHFVFNDEGEYISYRDVRMPDAQPRAESRKLSDSFLASSRHFLGWSPRVSSVVGKTQANPNVLQSGLYKYDHQFAFGSERIKPAQKIRLGSHIALGQNDSRWHAAHQKDCFLALKLISKRHFVFCDTDNNKAWLVRGSQALLHLVRGFINDARSQDYATFFKLRQSDVQPDIYWGDSNADANVAAFELIIRCGELDLWDFNQPRSSHTPGDVPVQANTVGDSEKLSSAIEAMCLLLLQVTELLDDEKTVGGRVRDAPVSRLEGFDFRAVAGVDALEPKYLDLELHSQGWVDFVRELKCITLFGRGFGDLIKPYGQACHGCLLNSTRTDGLLHVTVADLVDIIERMGDTRKYPWRVVEDVHWEVGENPFEDCACGSSQTCKHGRIQSFRKMDSVTPRTPPFDFTFLGKDRIKTGAVVVGQAQETANGDEEVVDADGEAAMISGSSTGAAASPASESVQTNAHKTVPQRSTPAQPSLPDDHHQLCDAAVHTQTEPDSGTYAPGPSTDGQHLPPRPSQVGQTTLGDATSVAKAPQTFRVSAPKRVLEYTRPKITRKRMKLFHKYY